MSRYFILHTPKRKKGKPADLGPSIFFDAASKLKVLSKDEKNPDPLGGYSGPETKKMENALKNNHIVEVKDFDESKRVAPATGETAAEEAKSSAKKPEEEEEEFVFTAEEGHKMTEEELMKYYKDNFDTEKPDRAKFKAMSKEEKIKFLLIP